MCFPMNFVKFLGTVFLQNTSGRLLLVKFIKYPLHWLIIFNLKNIRHLLLLMGLMHTNDNKAVAISEYSGMGDTVNKNNKAKNS